MLDLKESKTKWHADISPIYTYSSSFSIVYSVLMFHSNYRNCSYMNITMIVHNINLLKYIIPPIPESSNMFVFHKLNHLSLNFTCHSKDTAILRIMNGNHVLLQLMDVPPKSQYCMSMVSNIIHESWNLDSYIGHMRICYFNGCNWLIDLRFVNF